jgi:hypothetical protein
MSVIVAVACTSLFWVLMYRSGIRRTMKRQDYLLDLVDEIAASHEAVIEHTRERLSVAERRVNHLKLIAGVFEWREQNRGEDFNELVMWEIAGNLRLDIELASEVYDEIVRGAES